MDSVLKSSPGGHSKDVTSLNSVWVEVKRDAVGRCGAYLPQQDVTSLNSVWVEVKRGRVERRAKSVILGTRGRSRRRWRRCISRGYETVAYRLHPAIRNGARRQQP